MSAAPHLDHLSVGSVTAERRPLRPALASTVPTTAAPWHDSVVDTSHAKIAVRQTHGSGLSVLLLHGNSSSKAAFQEQMAGRIGAENHLIAIDLPGHGESGDAYDATRSYTMAGYADAAVEVLEHLGIDHAAVVGWSLGGHVGLEMATSFPGLVGLMITGTPPIGKGADAIGQVFHPHPHLALAGAPALSANEAADFAKLTLGAAFDPAAIEAVRRTDGRARARMVEDLMTGGPSDQRRIAETSAIPLAVVNGAEDPIVNVGYVAEIAYANLWKGRCHLLPKAGHAPFLEMPSVFNELLSRFIQDMRAELEIRLENDSLCFSG